MVLNVTNEELTRLDKILDEKITKFSEKVNKLTSLFNECVLDRREILEIISRMEKENLISDKDRIDAIKAKINEIKDNGRV